MTTVTHQPPAPPGAPGGPPATAGPAAVRVHRATATFRWIHWSNALAIVVCAVTGLYIADPYYVAHVSMLMAWNRALHLYAAMVLDVSMILIAYLYFFSTTPAGPDGLGRVADLRPTRRNLVRLQEAFLNVVMLNRRKRFDSARPDPLNTLFFILLHLMVLFQLLTGLQLYVEGLTDSMSSVGAWWPHLCHALTNWTLPVFGGPAGVRWWHHLMLYPIVGWTALHIYYEVWRAVMWREGDVSIMFGGSKWARPAAAARPGPEPRP